MNIDYTYEFEEIIAPIVSNNTVKRMHNYRQHCNTSWFEHCKNVAYFSYLICKKLNLDYVSISRAAMVHDLFLYDWREKKEYINRKGLHAFTHPKCALDNALKLFDLNDKEQDIILKHMWPLTIKLPKYKESYIITLVDKYCAILESLEYIQEKYCEKKLYKYSFAVVNIFNNSNL